MSTIPSDAEQLNALMVTVAVYPSTAHRYRQSSEIDNSIEAITIATGCINGNCNRLLHHWLASAIADIYHGGGNSGGNTTIGGVC